MPCPRAVPEPNNDLLSVVQAKAHTLQRPKGRSECHEFVFR